MSEQQPISTPFKLQLRRMRYQLLPVVVFAGALLLTLGLLKTQNSTPRSIGEVASNRIEVITVVDGTLMTLADTPIQLYAPVKKGQIIASLDDRAFTASLEVLNAETKQLNSQLQAVAYEYQQDAIDRQFGQADEARRLAIDIEDHRLALIERNTMLETENIRLKQADEKLGRLSKLSLTGVQAQNVVDEVELQRDVSLSEISGLEASIVEIESQLAAARLRQAGLSGQMSDQLASILAPIRKGIIAQEARVKELRYQGELLHLRSPIDGQISAVYVQPGQVVEAGSPIVAVSGSDSSYIVSYLRERQNAEAYVGMKVVVSTRGSNPQSYETTVERVGPAVEMVPGHQLVSQQMAEWGRPVTISVPEDFVLTPGELVNITFK